MSLLKKETKYEWLFTEMEIILCHVIVVIQASVDCGLENDVFLKDGQSYTFLFRCMLLS